MSKVKSPARAPAAPPAPPAVEAQLDQGTYGIYNLSDIRKSPTNRKRFNEVALQQLAANIKEMGVVQPILIRPVTPTTEQPEPYELVAGERRWRASGIAEVATIPAMCRTLSDKQAAEIQILENLQREDPHPLEEAEGYEQLMMNHGYNADQLADKVKKSRAYIYGRLKLCALTNEAREKFLNDEISASIALLVARIPVPSLQARALNEIITPSGWPPAPMSYRRAQGHLTQRYTLDLTTANFATDDARLLAAAGSCLKCPKRSGNQPLVFEDIKSADVCTDPDCFSEKRSAQYAKVIVIANKTGIPVLEGDEANQVAKTLWDTDSDFVKGGTPLWKFERNAPSTRNEGNAEQMIGKEKMPKPAKYLKDSDGVVTALYERSSIQAALEEAGVCETVSAHAARMVEQAKKGEVGTNNSAPSAEQLAREANDSKATTITAQRVALYRELRSRAAAGFSLGSLREFTKDALSEFNLPRQLADVYPFEIRDDAAACQHIDQAPLEEVQLLLVDLMLGNYLEVSGWQVVHGHVGADDDGFNTIIRMAKHEGIDPDEVGRKFEMVNTPIADILREDFTDLIRLAPERLAELTAVVMDTQPHNIAALQRAAEDNGFVWSKWQTPTPGSAWVKSDGAVTEVASSALAPADSISQVSNEAAVADGDYVDPADFIPAAPEPAKRASKAKTPKVKPTALAPAPAESWPWPKSATTSGADNKSETTEKEAA